MALPSAVTLGSVAMIVAAGVGLVAVTSFADEQDADRAGGTSPSATAPSTRTGPPATTSPDPQPDKPTKAEKARERKRERQRERQRQRLAVPRVFVEVYNNSGISGLAAATSARLESAGWSVVATDNWYGAIPANTVYYPEGMRAAAERLAKRLDYPRLRPAVSPMQFDRLTVIITSA